MRRKKKKKKRREERKQKVKVKTAVPLLNPNLEILLLLMPELRKLIQAS